jgi:hypothetical protein
MKSALLPKDLTQRIFGVDLECPVVLYGNDHLSVEVFLAGAPDSRSPRFEHICLEIKNRESFRKTCEAMNVEVNVVPKGDRLLMFVKDYDGNMFEIKEALT